MTTKRSKSHYSKDARRSSSSSSSRSESPDPRKKFKKRGQSSSLRPKENLESYEDISRSPLESPDPGKKSKSRKRDSSILFEPREGDKFFLRLDPELASSIQKKPHKNKYTDFSNDQIQDCFLEYIRQVKKGKQKEWDPEDLITLDSSLRQFNNAKPKSNKPPRLNKLIEEYDSKDMIIIDSEEDNNCKTRKSSKKFKTKKQNKRKRGRSISRSSSEDRKRTRSISHSSSEKSHESDINNISSAPRRVTYLHLADLDKDLRDALRRDVFWNIQRMPKDVQLNVDKTFESQKKLVTMSIIPALLKVLNLETFPIGEGVLYEMIHQRHRHQREEMMRKKKDSTTQTKEVMRRHGISRRKEKRTRRTNMINHLQKIDDPIVLKFKPSELNPIMMANVYHSPENSEVEDSEAENSDVGEEAKKNRIIIRDLKWRSDTLRMFLRDYLDVIYYQLNPDRRSRIRVYDNNNFVAHETTAPLNAPRWTKSGYEGSMKAIIEKAASKYGNSDVDNGGDQNEGDKGAE